MLRRDLQEIREEQIRSHYAAATEELRIKIRENPLRTKLYIYAGCVSREVAEELAHRFRGDGLEAVVGVQGFLSTVYYLNIELPEYQAQQQPLTVQHGEIKSTYESYEAPSDITIATDVIDAELAAPTELSNL